MYAALKTTQRGSGRVLRSRSPHGVEQEIHAYLITRQLLRIFRSRAAVERKIAARRVSFTELLSTVARSITRRDRPASPKVHHWITSTVRP
ncbi:hypothetical protein [Streptomyces viridosporus]|uniref:hypothetical protein n=1 Tax=Streptomyces viridosporus TaxID=67581 RepID=UPI000D1D07FF|nr:hypothetical protein [Streptomyces viridosporus]